MTTKQPGCKERFGARDRAQESATRGCKVWNYLIMHLLNANRLQMGNWFSGWGKNSAGGRRATKKKKKYVHKIIKSLAIFLVRSFICYTTVILPLSHGACKHVSFSRSLSFRTLIVSDASVAGCDFHTFWCSKICCHLKARRRCWCYCWCCCYCSQYFKNANFHSVPHPRSVAKKKY